MSDKAPTDKTEKLVDAIDDLDKDIEKLDTSLGRTIRSHGFWPTFLRGIIGAVGAAIGASLMIGLIVYILQVLAGSPFFGEWFSALLDQIQQNK